MNKFLSVNKNYIVDGNGKPVMLRGVNLGGWLMMEAYILGSPNFSEQYFRRHFASVLGDAELACFDKSFRQNFIRENDIADIASMGFNCLRVPFHYRIVENAPYQFEAEGLQFLDKVLEWAAKYKIWIILDLHAVPGCQNYDWHSDSMGEAELWKKAVYRKRTLALWEFLADRYKDEEYLAGYDLLNEAVVEDVNVLNNFYKKIIKQIRAVDRNHILFIEGNRWAMDIDCLERFDDDKYVLSIHNYAPIDFTFNFVPHLRYPLKSTAGTWNKDVTRRLLEKQKAVSQRHGVPVFVGEFGVNSRKGYFNEEQWLDDLLCCFKEFDFHWAYWTYKAVKQDCFPDGIFSYFGNPPWVNRQGPVKGWDTYAENWLVKKEAMIRSWHTDMFKENTGILKLCKIKLPA